MTTKLECQIVRQLNHAHKFAGFINMHVSVVISVHTKLEYLRLR